MSKSSEAQLRFLKDKVPEQSNQLVAKNKSSSDYWELVVVLEKNLANASPEVESFTLQHTVDKDLLHGDHMALVPYKTLSRQRAATDAEDRQQLLAKQADFNTEFRKFRKDMQSKIDLILVYLDE